MHYDILATIEDVLEIKQDLEQVLVFFKVYEGNHKTFGVGRDMSYT